MKPKTKAEILADYINIKNLAILEQEIALKQDEDFLRKERLTARASSDIATLEKLVNARKEQIETFQEQVKIAADMYLDEATNADNEAKGSV